MTILPRRLQPGRLARLLPVVSTVWVVCLSGTASGQEIDTVLTIAESAGTAADQSWSVSIQVLVAMTALAFLPTLLLAATSGTRKYPATKGHLMR